METTSQEHADGDSSHLTEAFTRTLGWNDWWCYCHLMIPTLVGAKLFSHLYRSLTFVFMFNWVFSPGVWSAHAGCFSQHELYCKAPGCQPFDNFPPFSAAISPASWREGQKLVKMVLGPVPKLPREERADPADGLSRTGRAWNKLFLICHYSSVVYYYVSHSNIVDCCQLSCLSLSHLLLNHFFCGIFFLHVLTYWQQVERQRSG